MMRGRAGWLVLALPLLVWAPTGLAAGHEALTADLAYAPDARLDGVAVAHEGGVLALWPGPGAGRFDLRAAHVDAVFARHYTPHDRVPELSTPALPDPLMPAAGRRSDAIQSNTIEIEERSLDDAALTLVERSALWNAVVFDDAKEGAPTLALPHGAYALANTGAWDHVVRPDVPQPGAIGEAAREATQAVRGVMAARADDASVTARGDFTVLLYGATFDLWTHDAVERVVTGRYEESYTRDDGLPGARTVNATLLLHVRDGELATHNPGRLALYAPRLHVQGDLAFPDARGTLRAGDAGRALDGGPYAVTGDLVVTALGPAYRDARGAARGDVHLDGRTVVAAPPALAPWIAGATAVAAGGLAVRFVPGLRRLAWGAVVAGFSLAGRDDALENPTRSQILDMVRERPGASLSGLQRDLGLGWGTTSYHVTYLERAGLLVTKRTGGKRLLFAANGDSRLADAPAWGVLQNGNARQMCAALFDAPAGLSQSDAARRIGCTPQYAGRILRRLEATGLVACTPAPGRRRVYRPEPALHVLREKLAPTASVPARVPAATPA